MGQLLVNLGAVVLGHEPAVVSSSSLWAELTLRGVVSEKEVF